MLGWVSKAWAAEGLGTLLIAGGRVGSWEDGQAGLPWGRSLADKDQTSEGAVTLLTASISRSAPGWGSVTRLD